MIQSKLCLIFLIMMSTLSNPKKRKASCFTSSISGSFSLPKKNIDDVSNTSTNSDSIIIMKHNYESISGREIAQIKQEENESFIYNAKRTNNEVTSSSQLKGTERNSYSSQSNIMSISSALDALHPITTIEKLTANLGTRHIQGSCFILSNGYIMTAAHCVYIDRQYMTNLTVSFSRIKAESFTITESYLPKDWIYSDPMSSTSFTPTDEQKNNDWAILKIAEPNKLDIYGATSLITNADFSRSVYIAFGYPAGQDLKYSKGYGILSETPHRYNLYTYILSGMSGGPVISYFTEWDERTQEELKYISVIGIISTKEPDNDDRYLWTGVTRITNTMVDFISRFGV